MAVAEQERETVRAQARYVRCSARKARLVLEHIRGKPAVEARSILAFQPRAAARDAGKVLASAIANAENNAGHDEDDLIVWAAYADEGPTLKRWRARARGRVNRIKQAHLPHHDHARGRRARRDQAPARRAPRPSRSPRPEAQAAAQAAGQEAGRRAEPPRPPRSRLSRRPTAEPETAAEPEAPADAEPEAAEPEEAEPEAETEPKKEATEDGA